MKLKENEITDDDLIVITPRAASRKEGPQPEQQPEHKTRWWIWAAAIVAVGGISALTLTLHREPAEPETVQEVFEPVVEDATVAQEKEALTPFGTYDSLTTKAFTEVIRQEVNDIPLRIYIPHNAVASLCIGLPDMKDHSIIFSTQAADIRADNGKINGAFVLQGKPLAWGLSKRGYCSIINDVITVGVADNSPLFEEATEKEGYFFRQYGLVDNGTLVENELKNKSLRRAICSRCGEIFVAMTDTRESLHDFAQALVDIGVENAIYLVGADAYGFCRSEEGDMETFHSTDRSYGNFKNNNSIVWRAKQTP